MKDSEFDDLLRSAGEKLPLPATFHTDVWKLIEATDVVSKTVSPWPVNVISMLVRPWPAASGLAAMVALGLWMGALGVPGDPPNEMAYVRSISPFAQSHP
jgi:hypothetical protein